MHNIFQVCCKSRSSSNGEASPLPSGTCGQRSACGVDRRTGGSTRRGECEFGEYPWLVRRNIFPSLIYTKSDIYIYIDIYI